MYGFPLGEGELAAYKGPRIWQCEELDRLGAWLRNPATRHQTYRRAISSGHGPGKTTLGAFISWWALSTFLDTMERVTANTERQLTTTTQPEFQRWFRIAINSHWFQVNASSIKAIDDRHATTWRLDFVPWSEENAQSFAGKHNAGRRMVFLFEEASPIPQSIYRVTNGALTDANTEKIFFTIGNPTLNTGPFYESVFGSDRSRWTQAGLNNPGPRIIDSRDVEGCDLGEIQSWLDECGGDEDADYFRTRARGLFPKGGSGQFIDLETISRAQQREVIVLDDEPLVAGVDFAWGGADDNVIRFRRGADGRSIPPIKIKGEFTRDAAVMVGKLSDVLNSTYGGRKVAMLFFDSAGIAAPVESRLRSLGHKNIIVVNFGADSPDPHHAYFRDYMWGKMKTWLATGAIDKDSGLAADLAKPMLIDDNKQRIKLESKKLMMQRLKKLGSDGSSPDDADALALTFAMPIVPRPAPKKETRYRHSGQDGQNWMS
jgi:hypothetical protein